MRASLRIGRRHKRPSAAAVGGQRLRLGSQPRLGIPSGCPDKSISEHDGHGRAVSGELVKSETGVLVDTKGDRHSHRLLSQKNVPSARSCRNPARHRPAQLTAPLLLGFGCSTSGTAKAKCCPTGLAEQHPSVETYVDAGGLTPNTWQRFERLGSAWQQAKLGIEDGPYGDA